MRNLEKIECVSMLKKSEEYKREVDFTVSTSHRPILVQKY